MNHPASIPPINNDGHPPAPKRRKRSTTEGDKKHVCDWDGCGKAFSRIDHLSRHKLNHNPSTIYNCPKCAKVFVRADLLVRHTERHERRESNSGNTRSLILAAAASTASASASSVSNNPTTALQTTTEDWKQQQQSFFNFPPTPTPTSQSSTESPQIPLTTYTLPSPLSTFDFPPATSLPSNPQNSLQQQQQPLEFYPPPPPSTATSTLPNSEDPFAFIQNSYGAPFVSSLEYDWLFDQSGNFDVRLGMSRPASPGLGDEEFALGNGFGGESLFGGGNGITVLRGDAFQVGTVETRNEGFNQSSFLVSPPPAVGGGTGAGNNWSELMGESAIKEEVLDDLDEPKRRLIQSNEELNRKLGGGGASIHSTPIYSLGSAGGPSPSVTDNSDVVDPSIYIDSTTRDNLLEYLGPEWESLKTDKRMTNVALQEYLILFWTRVSETQGPAIHRASFRPHQVPIPLLLSMILLGCYFADSDSHHLAARLHNQFRGKFISSDDFRPRAPLWVHQTALLIILFGKLCSTRSAHEMAHIFYSAVVTLSRRSGLFSQKTTTIPEEYKDDLEVRWAAWIEEESSKRIASVGFAIDVEHAALFRHSPTLSAFQIQLYLPCDDNEWEATTAHAWASLHARARPPIPFISALKASLVTGGQPPVMNPFSRILVLHGLLSVAQDLQWRDHVVGLSQPERHPQNWRDMLSGAYNSWKARLDDVLLAPHYPTSQLLRASISLYALAHISLSIDLHELQIFAGADTALGLTVSPALYLATRDRIRIWAASKDGRSATWHAAHFVRSSLQHWFQNTDDLAACLYHRWSVYIACLTLYAFVVCTNGPPGPKEKEYNLAALKFVDSMCTDNPEDLLTIRQNNVICLCQTMQDYIQSSRWDIGQEGAKLLRRLIEGEEGSQN